MSSGACGSDLETGPCDDASSLFTGYTGREGLSRALTKGSGPPSEQQRTSAALSVGYSTVNAAFDSMSAALPVEDSPKAKVAREVEGATSLTTAEAGAGAADGAPDMRHIVTEDTPFRRGMHTELELRQAAETEEGARGTAAQQEAATSGITAAASGRGDSEVPVVKLLPLVLGKGGCGCVYAGEMGGLPVAVKLIAEDLSQLHPDDAADELEVLARCTHPCIVRVLAACAKPPRPCIVMESARPPMPAHGTLGESPDRWPPRLVRLITECWDKDPRRRPAAAEVVKRLLVFQQDLELGSVMVESGDVKSTGGEGAASRGVLEALEALHISQDLMPEAGPEGLGAEGGSGAPGPKAALASSPHRASPSSGLLNRAHGTASANGVASAARVPPWVSPIPEESTREAAGEEDMGSAMALACSPQAGPGGPSSPTESPEAEDLQGIQG
ncbi:hypothetical protein HYH03_010159 [Edaphochlamys debaryana]|nr:hypothetical protein HYH03_010159 [Edaphochlamys debaryana]|eukprot:KAG2491592.1 hypothetical protein HYH03_010159 [Edaphochlamys debaryana]